MGWPFPKWRILYISILSPCCGVCARTLNCIINTLVQACCATNYEFFFYAATWMPRSYIWTASNSFALDSVLHINKAVWKNVLLSLHTTGLLSREDESTRQMPCQLLGSRCNSIRQLPTSVISFHRFYKIIQRSELPDCTFVYLGKTWNTLSSRDYNIMAWLSVLSTFSWINVLLVF